MKKLKTLMIAVISCMMFNGVVFAQAPKKMSYQAVVRNSANNLIPNQSVGIKISILQGSESGTAVFEETQNPTTNQNGLINIQIGEGTMIAGNIADIEWHSDIFFLKTEIDPAGGNNYTITGVSQLLSVPYALHANSADTITGNINELDPVFNGSAAHTINASHITNWNNAYTWGNHATAGYLTTFTETDPLFNTSVAAGITSADTAFWNSNVASFIEADPIFNASVAAGLTSLDTANWNNKLSSFSEADPIFSSSIAAGISIADTARWNNKLDSIVETDPMFNAWDKDYNDLINKPDLADSIATYADGSETKVTAGYNTYITGTGTTADPYVVGARTHYVGEHFGGGIVFYVYDNQRHGLIATAGDNVVEIPWWNSQYRLTGTTGDGYGAGEMNTTLAVAMQLNDSIDGNFAAKICADFSITVNGVTYGDWYLPSLYELSLLYEQKALVGGFENGGYWSSTEYSAAGAWYVDFYNGLQHWTGLKHYPLHVRAIRKF